MNAHTIIVHIEEPGHALPIFIGSRAAAIINNDRSRESGCGHARIVNDSVAVFEIYAPNCVSTNEILSAVNLAIAEYAPDIPSIKYTTGLFCTVACINQDI